MELSRRVYPWLVRRVRPGEPTAHGYKTETRITRLPINLYTRGEIQPKLGVGTPKLHRTRKERNACDVSGVNSRGVVALDESPSRRKHVVGTTEFLG